LLVVAKLTVAKDLNRNRAAGLFPDLGRKNLQSLVIVTSCAVADSGNAQTNAVVRNKCFIPASPPTSSLFR
jgi:hypothetical protein